MAMNRILEFTPSQEEAVVSRILVLIHQAVDEAFPSVAQNNRQFTKTVFSGDGESTAIGRPGGEGGEQGGRAAFGGDEDTANDLRPGEAGGEPGQTPEIPPPPSHNSRESRGVQGHGAQGTHAVSGAQAQPVRRPDPPPRPTAATGFSNHPQALRQPPRSGVENRSAATNLDATMEGLDKDNRPDWVSRILIAVFIAGAILLAYSLFVAP